MHALAGFLAGSPLLQSQLDPVRDHSRVPAMKELMTSFEFEAVMYAKQTRPVYNYRAYGEESEFTLRRNRQAFDWVKLVTNQTSTATIQTATEVFGTPMAFPIMISPTALHGDLDKEGEQATHKGAEAASNTPMILSNNSSLTFDKVAPVAKSPMWIQLYPKQSLDANRVYLEPAQEAGAKAVVVTIDQQSSTYERSGHDRNLNPGRGGRFTSTVPLLGTNPYRVPANRLWYEWKFFSEIRPFVKVPIIAKGILTAEDAKLCIENGVDGIYVSNHGGRSLDYGPSSLEVLPEIVDAVGGKVPILFDSGLRRGSDILKALALGANAVCLGRVPLWGLGSFGAAGVTRVLEIMQAELVEAMRQTGCTSLQSVNRKIVLANFP
jgi:isopentenyl diphosphate isomerase/L-lactate dehydrogenase-like FMN-dependent dehydrogenase